jgi:hypothetical protein
VRRLPVLLGIALAINLCASCVLPLTVSYYLPAAAGAEVISTSCSGDPPYAMSVFAGDSPQFHLMVSLVPSTLTVIVHPDNPAVVALDPTLIVVLVDGKTIVPKSIQYRVGKSSAAPAIRTRERVDVSTDYLIIELSVDLGGTSSVIARLPSITVAGQVGKSPEISFKWERRTRLITIAGNC